MESNRFESLALVAAVVGAAVLGSQSLVIGFGAAAIGDIALLLALFAFDSTAIRSGAQSLAFSAVCGFCVLTPFELLVNGVLTSVNPTSDANHWFAIGVWLVATLILFSVDRFRMSSREPVGLAGTGLAGTPANIPLAFKSPQVSSYRPAPISVEPAPAASPAPVPTAVYTPAPMPEPIFEATSLSNPAIPATPVVPSPDVTAIPPGREALIYLQLVGEGLNVLRTVRAENLGRDYYRIADIMPEGEQWEFTPGQVVRCRKKSLSNGKQMVAYEEAPRAQ